MHAFRLTDEQAAVAEHDPSQHARVLAGPGTGKSFSVVALVERLSGTGPPLRVRLVTFTRAATAELAEKLAAHSPEVDRRPNTIHSFALSVLAPRPAAGGLPEPLRLVDDWERDKVLHPTLSRRLGVRIPMMRKLFAEQASGWESLSAEQDPKIKEEDRRRFLGSWQEHRQVFGYTLPGELPFALRRALIGHPDLPGADFDLLVVDEYQDLNACDLNVLRLLAERGCTIIGVGDDDQSIYGFRKAHPEGIRRFPRDYPGAVDYPLSVTHRCGRRILDWAQHVIGQDPERDPRRPTPRPAEGSPDGEVALLSFRGERAEARGVAQIARSLIDHEGVPPAELLVLLRGDHKGRFSTPIKEELERLSVPCADPNEIERVFSDGQNRVLLAYSRLAEDCYDSLAWATLLSLADGIGPALVDHLYARARAAGTQFGRVVVTGAQDSFPGSPRGSGGRAATLVQAALKSLENLELPAEIPASGWGAWLIEQAESGHLPRPGAELSARFVEGDTLVEEGVTLGKYLSQLRLALQDAARAKSDGVRVMSMAQSKGLTVQAAILAALEDDVIPRPEVDVYEEGRLLYVALTRAKRFVYGTWAQRRGGPTARSGRGRPRGARTYSRLLVSGPVESEDGMTFIARRWPKK